MPDPLPAPALECRRHDGRLYFSGVTAAQGSPLPPSLYLQSLAAFARLKHDLENQGLNFSDIVEITVTLTGDPAQAVQELGDALHDLFGSQLPNTVVIPEEKMPSPDLRVCFDITAEPTPLPLALDPSARRRNDPARQLRPWWLQA